MKLVVTLLTLVSVSAFAQNWNNRRPEFTAQDTIDCASLCLTHLQRALGTKLAGLKSYSIERGRYDADFTAKYQDGGAEKSVEYHCHYHGAHKDCH